MIGGTIQSTEFLYVKNGEKVFDVLVAGTGCEATDRISVKLSVSPEKTHLLRKGTPIWWHDKNAYLGADDTRVNKIGNSFNHYHAA